MSGPMPVSGSTTSSSDDTLPLRGVGLAVILLSSLIGSLSPLLPGPAGVILTGPLAKYIRAGTAGAMLALAFIHVLSDSFADFDEAGSLNQDEDMVATYAYPWAALCCLLGLVLNSFVENLLCGHLHAVQPIITPATDKSLEVSPSKKGHEEVVVDEDVELGKSTLTGFSGLKNDLLAYSMELGCCFHSVIIGVDLGLMVDDGHAAVSIMIIVLCFHQLIEGLGLGTVVTQGYFTTFKKYTMCIIYSLTTPIGVAIGMGASATYDPTAMTGFLVKGAFNGVSAGLLIHIGCALLAEFAHGQDVQDSSGPQRNARWGLYGSALLAAGVMSVLGIWA